MLDQNLDRQVDLLLTGATVVTMDAQRRVYAPGAVALRGHEIVAVGPQAEVEGRYTASRVIACPDQVIMPGLVNTHTHMPMSLLRGLADDLRLDVWLYGYVLPVEREFVNPEFCFLGTQLSCAEMLLGGTTCYADMYYHEEEIAWATVQAGMRGICGETVMKLPTPDADSFDQSLQYCADFCQRWQGHDLIVAAPAPHSPYMTTADILRQTTELARTYKVPQLIHVAETADEVDGWLSETGLRPVRWLEEQGVLASKVVAAHCVHVNTEDIQILARHKVGVAHNPTSNLKLASGIAPVAEMLARGVRLGVGTDGCASNNDLDMFEEMRLAALLPKVATHDPVAAPASEVVAMATIYGAQALHMDHLIGSLEPGKRADIIVIDSRQPHIWPHYDTTGQNIYSQIAYTTHAADVRHVFVNGKLVVEDRQLQTIDLSAVIEQAGALAKRINRFFVSREDSIVDKLVDIGGLEQQETYEVQIKGVLQDEAAFEAGMAGDEVHITSHTSRDQYDTYFVFGDGAPERIRYREDNVIEPDGSLEPIYTLTLMGPAKEAVYADGVVLSRSRYAAPSNRSLRFYREYFGATSEQEISKHRERYHVRYRGVDFAVNLDTVTRPAQKQRYVEIKSRTWSQQDAIRKAGLISELVRLLGAQPEDLLQQEYVDMFDAEV